MKEKELDDFERKRKRMDLLNSKVNLILPELMSRNIKLIERLKNKLKVSSFFNNIEHRNKRYFQDFIFSSDKRAKDLKTGLKINRAIKQGSKAMSLLCKQMSDDVILKNANMLLKEKKLISENTEQETHIKINELIQNLKTAVKTPYGLKIKPMKKIIKSLSQDEIKEAQEFIGEKIKKEEKEIQDKINKYLKKMHNSLDKYDKEVNDDKTENNNSNDEDNTYRRKKLRKKKEFNRYVENIYMKDHIKFINYTKPKPFQIKDKESANLKRIQNCLYPPSIEQLANQQNEKDDNDSDNISIQSKIIFNVNKNKKDNFLNRNSSMSNIKSNLNINKIIIKKNNNKDIIDEVDNIDVTGKDTLEVLNNLVNQGKYLPERMEKKLEKVNSLIDVDLPYPTSYELVLTYFKNLENSNKNQKYFSFYPSSNLTTKFDNLKNTNKTLPEITPDMKKKLSFIKDDIKNMKNITLKKKGIFDYMFKTYLGAKTVNNKNEKINFDKKNEIKKKFNHKNSMDNIFEKKENTVFVTLKNLLEQQKNDNIKRKIRSCNSVEMKNIIN